jgi:hypothetical protein
MFWIRVETVSININNKTSFNLSVENCWSIHFEKARLEETNQPSGQRMNE